ncbi:MAG TPA: type II toxin-antitoxin system HicB family antitoxin [Methylovirgula sp.]
MKPYIVIVHKDPDSAYGLTFPDAPGCFSAADEIDELFARAAEALTLWTEAMVADHQTIPAPRELSQLKRDPEWADCFTDAALVIAVPAPHHDGRVAA